MEEKPTAAAAETPESSRKVATIRRNPIRKARVSSIWVLNDKIPPPDIPQNHPQIPPSSSSSSLSSNGIAENLKVFLRIRPSVQLKPSQAQRRGRVYREIKIQECIELKDSHSVTVTAPAPPIEQKRRRSAETFGGFAFVFSGDASQQEVFDKMAMPLVEEFVQGRSGMLVALGPTGSGKTYTVFGRRRDPGVLPLALGCIFQRDEMKGSDLRISMLEICSERGRGERMVDLMGDGAELSLQQWTVKGSKEIMVSGVAEAEAAVEGGRMRRSTAATNSNCISSRSQCIISIRNAQNGAMFAIADLAGSEKQKRTGNHGARLAESGFINNTLMVFGQCLRALLEHQKNPSKPLQKHCQNSMLTRYLRDYLEGRKRMVLILTVKPGEADYLDTSSLLRHASPLMKITFQPSDPVPLPKRRQISGIPVAELPKRMKISSAEAKIENFGGCATCEEKEKENQVMRKLSRSLLTLLRKYKKMAEDAEKESLGFRVRLKEEEVRNSELVCEIEGIKMNTQRANLQVPHEAHVLPNEGGAYDQTETIMSEKDPRESPLSNEGDRHDQAEKTMSGKDTQETQLFYNEGDTHEQTEKTIRKEDNKENLKEEPKSEGRKQKRRLLPAASLLVRGVDGLGLDEEGGKRPKRSQGDDNTTTLLRLLKPNLYS